MGASVWWFTPVVVVIGWFVLRHFHNERETRKEIRQQVSEVTGLVESIQQNCYAYYSKAGSDESIRAISQDVRCKLKQGGFRASMLNQRLPGSGLMARYIKFRQAVSSRLDDTSRPAIAAGDPLYEEISSTGGMFITALDSSFNNRFRGKSSA